MRDLLDKLRRYRMGPLIGLVLICIALTLMSDRFFTPANILNIARQVSINTLLAVGMTFVIISGGIDLSVGSILAFAGALAAGALASGIDTGLVLLYACLIGLAGGTLNGLLIAYGRIAPFVATLGTMTLFRGATLIYTEGRPIRAVEEGFNAIGGGYLGPIPTPVVITAVMVFLAWFVLNRMTVGRRVFAVGGNEEAAVLSGVKATYSKVFVYAVSGLMCGLAGAILTSRLMSAQPTAGAGYELDAIAAVVLGGTSLSGGQGGVLGTLVGALIIGVLDNGLNILNVSSFYQQAVKGIVILIAVLLDRRNAARG
ncbi:ribose transport system permease protein rbsc [Heliomicrobium modesticaldum Ice1]|uniref:Ribose transport system permease protein rbsc n=1 Tax=Heliobacterium modesticaldum (strain ATCC 51547 / Ice1) TaxID=498761 RepID=B0TAB9_HELMI|nr:ribose ABC transporter permease [Heliomicrobium modesticaldum]ABZ84969.1 ribose transport system permease protein rbsc [Heliomicrobium modesticaldum Ice1]